MDLTPAFARTQGQEENSLEGQCFKKASLRGLNGALPIGETPGEFQEGMPPDPYVCLYVNSTVQETSEILILLTFIGELPSCQQC